MQNGNPYSLTLYAVAIFAMMSLAPASLPVSWHSGTAFADDTTEVEVIIRSLERRRSRGLELSPSPDDEVIEELIKKRRQRGLTIQEKDELYEASSEKEQIDLPVYFAYNSAEISPEARSTLDQLGTALSSVELERDTFLVGGHTDRRGSRGYNQSLSERRAEAVRTYLLRYFDIDADALIAVGYGFDQPKNPRNPMAAENRRVQLVNITTR